VAEDCFGTKIWLIDTPKPKAWLEFEVEDIKKASEEMKRKGYNLLLDSFEEPYGKILSRFLSPERILVGLVITPCYVTQLRNLLKWKFAGNVVISIR
jgi:hypothetical protein